MELKMITASFAYKVNLGNYENVDIAISLMGAIEPGESPEEALAALWTQAKDEVRKQANDVKKRRGLPSDEAGEKIEGAEPENPFGGVDPHPKTLGDLVTPKQLWMIRNLAREIGCDPERECVSLLQCKLEEISKRAANSFIDYLKRRESEVSGAGAQPHP
jgi:hypothetical protein